MELESTDVQPGQAPELAHIQATLVPVNVGVGKLEDSDDRILTIGPFLLTLAVPLPPALARALSQHLAGGIVIATSQQKLPRMDIPRR